MHTSAYSALIRRTYSPACGSQPARQADVPVCLQVGGAGLVARRQRAVLQPQLVVPLTRYLHLAVRERRFERGIVFRRRWMEHNVIRHATHVQHTLSNTRARAGRGSCAHGVQHTDVPATSAPESRPACRMNHVINRCGQLTEKFTEGRPTATRAVASSGVTNVLQVRFSYLVAATASEAQPYTLMSLPATRNRYRHVYPALP